MLVDDLAEPVFKLERDPRTTRVGRWLRRWSVDELPQLVNVLRGEMSLVGPRPEQVEFVDRYSAEQRRRLIVKPGLTGPMQVYGRGALGLDERIAVESDYIENLSIGRDLRILGMTVAAVFRGERSVLTWHECDSYEPSAASIARLANLTQRRNRSTLARRASLLVCALSFSHCSSEPTRCPRIRDTHTQSRGGASASASLISFGSSGFWRGPTSRSSTRVRARVRLVGREAVALLRRPLGGFREGVPSQRRRYPLYLIIGIVLWTFVADGVSATLPSIVARGSVLRRISFPPIVIPLAATLTAAMTFLVNCVVVVVFIAASQVVPTPRWLLLVPLLAELYLYVLALALITSTLYVRFRDVSHLWEVMAILLFFSTPIMYPVTILPTWIRPGDRVQPVRPDPPRRTAHHPRQRRARD